MEKSVSPHENLRNFALCLCKHRPSITVHTAHIKRPCCILQWARFTEFSDLRLGVYNPYAHENRNQSLIKTLCLNVDVFVKMNLCTLVICIEYSKRTTSCFNKIILLMYVSYIHYYLYQVCLDKLTRTPSHLIYLTTIPSTKQLLQ